MIAKRHFQKLGFAIFTIIAVDANNLNAQIIPDATLLNNSTVKTQGNIRTIEDGSQVGSNLFHSFEQFSIPVNQIGYFNNSTNIQNIITRITGKSISNINGILRTNGTANLFLINPNGIIFGKSAALDIGGSFLATTASSINFADGTKFSATQPETAPLLTINVPVGLQFGSAVAAIRNQSQASVNGVTNFFGQPVGLQVPTGKTLALVGGDIILEGGNLTVDSGRIELGSFATNSFVNLNSTDKGWILGYEGAENFRNIRLIQQNINDSTVGSIVDVSGEDGGGSIRLQGNNVELVGSYLNTGTRGVTDAGDLTINARKLVARDGALIITATLGKGAAGNITVNASDSVELIGDNFDLTLLSSDSFGDGNGGNITINTTKLLIYDGALVSVVTSGMGDNSQFILATGKGGNLTVNASELIEIVGTSAAGFGSSLASKTFNSADAGNIRLSTKQLIVKHGGEISVGNESLKLPPNFTVVGDTTKLGNAGELKVTADSILLNNQGKLISETESANGGNINLQLKDLLLLRRNSQISTNAGKAGSDGNGGSININIPNGFIVAVPQENSDITANAFTGNGGRVDINANGIFGIQPRSRDELTELLSPQNPNELNPQELITSDITAISQQNPNLNGELNIVAQDVEPTRELVELPEIPIDTKVSQVCRFTRGNQSEFVYIRRGGLPSLPGEALSGDSGLDVGWVDGGRERGGEGEMGRRGDGETRERGDRGTGGQGDRGKYQMQNRIVEATGWIKNKTGDIFFVAGKDNFTGKKFNQSSCS
ncbi:filamentous hemagglutinin-like protein [Calothrix parasitica NIES-267]|uniref:Filamentous hemagglutinin-like protein n=1 Tax=Calothrix parasitica NIES-267 TaxID=1973488 RepID=A0A1Z4LXN2_9CYAN|nr:filamentous hemagglutinin-like protein [Calothrix parasitica NIES-267]